MTAVANHLWQSTLFAGLIAVAAFALRGNPARLRYRLWLAASLKFLLPLSWLVTLGTRVEMPVDQPVVRAMAVEQITTSFAPVPLMRTEPGTAWWLTAIVAIWLMGAALLLARWFRQWLTIRRGLRGAERLAVAAPIPVLASRLSMEPGVFGILRPVLLLPAGIAAKLTVAELDAVVAHELAHVRRRDNLTAALHMLVEALCWFHPLVWWIGARLVEERERACDEAVLQQGNEPQIYAQSIVNVCRHYVASPLPCAAGVSGADLRQRIEEIMANRLAARLTLPRKMALVALALIAVTAPLALGILQAQTLPPAPAFGYEVATIKPNKSGDQNSRIGPGPQGGLRAENVTVMQLLRFAYDLQDFQFASVPGWVTSDRLDLTFTPDRAEAAPNPKQSRAEFESIISRQRQRLQAVLRDRFALVLRTEKRELPFFALAQVKGGHRLKAASDGPPHMQTGPGGVTAKNIHLTDLTRRLASFFGRHVIDETGLSGPFDFAMQWTPNPNERSEADVDRSVIVTALNDQLGLKLESRKGPVTVFVIEKIERPTDN